MTTILGLKTTVGEDAIVLAADRQMTVIGRDVYGNKHSLEEVDFKKIYTGRNFAFSMAGAAIPPLMEFWKNLQITNPEDPTFIDLEHILIDDGIFDEVRQMNLEVACGNVDEINADAQTHFIFATNYGGQPKLFYVHPLGGIDEFEAFLPLGSGTEYIEDKLSEAYAGGTLEGPKVSFPQAVKLAEECIALSRRDPYSGGTMPDIAVITADSIKYYGDKLIERYRRFKQTEMDRIIKEHTK